MLRSSRTGRSSSSKWAPRSANAAKEWHEAEAADRKYQQALSETRAAAREFELELQMFRETLALVTARTDVDYQKLRARRAGSADPEDDPSAPAPLEPAAAG